ncbi:MAG: UDP-3-O-acyl-N-acetylglucosamine deacetylase [Alphaproteobacteria bacterium]
MPYILQKTIAKKVTTKGIALHSGVSVTLSLSPAAANTGILFRRTDVPNSEADIILTPQTIADTRLCTVVANEYGHRVMTIEHLMAALAAQSIDNVIVEVSAMEIPAMDGSADLFMDFIGEAGIKELSTPRKMIKILKPIRVEDAGRIAELKPSEKPRFGLEIDFESKAIGNQFFEIDMIGDNFGQKIAGARTFGFVQDLELLRKNGLALGGSLDNAVVLDGDRILNTEPLRYENEFVRHKILDAVGDLFVCGKHIMGSYYGYKSGHEMNNKLLRALFADESQYEIINAPKAFDLLFRDKKQKKIWQENQISIAI